MTVQRGPHGYERLEWIPERQAYRLIPVVQIDGQWVDADKADLVETLIRERDEACEGESIRAQERDEARMQVINLRAAIQAVLDSPAMMGAEDIDRLHAALEEEL